MDKKILQIKFSFPIPLNAKFTVLPGSGLMRFSQYVYNNVTVRRYLSHVMRKPAFCIWEIKGPYQLRDNRAADQCLCFGRFIDSVLTALHTSSYVA